MAKFKKGDKVKFVGGVHKELKGKELTIIQSNSLTSTIEFDNGKKQAIIPTNILVLDSKAKSGFSIGDVVKDIDDGETWRVATIEKRYTYTIYMCHLIGLDSKVKGFLGSYLELVSADKEMGANSGKMQSALYCNCDSLDKVKSVAYGSAFIYCRGCKKEVLGA